MNIELQAKKLQNKVKLLDLMPLELWRMVDGFTDAKSHTLLRASCSFFRTWLTWEKDVDFEDYVQLMQKTKSGVTRRITYEREEAFQSAVRLNPRTLKQEHYDYLCDNRLYLEVFRICKLALLEPFTCGHINLGAEENYAIRKASELGHYHEVKLLLQDPKVDPAAQENYAIIMASLYGHLAVVELLLQDLRVDPTANDNRAISYSSHKGHLAVVDLLLQDAKVDPTARNNEAIRNASYDGHLAVVELLLHDLRVDPSAHGNEAIINASYTGHRAVVELLLQDPKVDPSAGENEAIRYASHPNPP